MTSLFQGKCTMHRHHAHKPQILIYVWKAYRQEIFIFMKLLIYDFSKFQEFIMILKYPSINGFIQGTIWFHRILSLNFRFAKSRFFLSNFIFSRGHTSKFIYSRFLISFFFCKKIHFPAESDFILRLWRRQMMPFCFIFLSHNRFYTMALWPNHLL